MLLMRSLAQEQLQPGTGHTYQFCVDDAQIGLHPCPAEPGSILFLKIL